MNIKKLFGGKKRTAGEPMTVKEIKKLIKKRMVAADDEFARGYDLIEEYPRSVSILGSARFKEGNKYYEQARSLGKRIAT